MINLKKESKLILIIAIVAIIGIAYVSATSKDMPETGVLNQKLTEQYTRAMSYTIVDEQIIPKVGCPSYKVYDIGDKYQLFSKPLHPDYNWSYSKDITLDSRGVIIEEGWSYDVERTIEYSNIPAESVIFSVYSNGEDLRIYSRHFTQTEVDNLWAIGKLVDGEIVVYTIS